MYYEINKLKNKNISNLSIDFESSRITGIITCRCGKKRRILLSDEVYFKCRECGFCATLSNKLYLSELNKDEILFLEKHFDKNYADDIKFPLVLIKDLNNV